MNLECCENLVSLNVDDSICCNGGSVAKTSRINILPTTIYEPAPDPDLGVNP